MRASISLALLLAACSLHGHAAPAKASYDRAADDHGFTVFMKDGGWCWYQDPRAILHDGKVIAGSVKGNGDGSALIGVFDIVADKSLGNVVMVEKFKRDDHNSPVFYARKDGSVLATCALHSNDRLHHSRISDPKDFTKWGDAFTHERKMPGRDNVTYMNLYPMRNEGRLYNFFRGIEFNPTFVTSTDEGLTWTEPVHFIKSEVKGRHRPYARYAGNGTDTVYVSFTDAHPRDYGNSIYYAEFRDGKFFKADGSLIKNLGESGPLRPSESELVYKGTGNPGRAADLSAEGAAWTSSISADGNGHPHIGYTLYLSNTDHRYRLASWDGSKWSDREVAYGGKCLYDRESSYTGLITTDPVDPTVVFISTDVDPSTGKDTGGKHEIYRARIGPDDDVKSIQWKPVTTGSKVRNIRPMVLRDGDQRVVLWNRGDFLTYMDYDLDTIGIVETVKGR